MKTMEIPRIDNAGVLFFTDVEDNDEQPLCTAVNEAVAKRMSLAEAALAGAYLGSADLRWARFLRADLSRAWLGGANLEHASLREASLSGAKIPYANLTAVDACKTNFAGADLHMSNMSRAELQGANLRRTNLLGVTLTGANLSDAQLEYTNLHEANLAEIRADLWALLDRAPGDAAGLLDALRTGKLAYRYKCACVATIAALRGCKHDGLPELGCDISRPIERWLLPLEAGDTPEKHPIAKITEGWIVEWIAAHGSSPSLS